MWGSELVMDKTIPLLMSIVICVCTTLMCVLQIMRNVFVFGNGFEAWYVPMCLVMVFGWLMLIISIREYYDK